MFSFYTENISNIGIKKKFKVRNEQSLINKKKKIFCVRSKSKSLRSIETSFSLLRIKWHSEPPYDDLKKMLIPNGWARFESRAYTFPLCTSGPLLPLFVVVENLIYTKDSLNCNCLTQFFLFIKLTQLGNQTQVFLIP